MAAGLPNEGAGKGVGSALAQGLSWDDACLVLFLALVIAT
jgi:hypothetical protein